MFNRKKEENEFDPYSVDKLARVPLVLKILVLKYWLGGAAAYFIFMGLNSMLGQERTIDSYFIFCIILGMFADLIVNRFIRMMGTSKKPTDKYIFVSGTSFVTLFLNILYTVVLFIMMFYAWSLLDLIFNFESHETFRKYIYFEEPFTFALLYVLADSLALAIKRYSILLYKKIRYKNISDEDE